MKTLFIIIGLAFACGASGQNNPIFAGGSDDGWAAADFAQAANNIFNGGSGDGWSSQSISPFTLAVIENTFGQLKAWPNPTMGNITFDLGGTPEVVTLIIVNEDGKVIFDHSYRNIKTITADIGGAAGVYFARLTADGKPAVFKIIKK